MATASRAVEPHPGRWSLQLGFRSISVATGSAAAKEVKVTTEYHFDDILSYDSRSVVEL